MSKRGISNIIMVVVLAVIVIAIIAWLGFRGISSMAKQRSLTQEAEFQVALMQKFEVARHSFGSLESVSMKAPDAVEMLCIYDKEKPAFPPIAIESPILRQQLYFAESGDSENNIFIVKQADVVALKKPEVRAMSRLVCFQQQDGKLEFYIEGKGKEMVVK